MSENLVSYTTKVQNESDDTSAASQTVIQRAVKETYDDILKFTAKYLIGTAEEDITATPSQRYVSPTKTYQDLKNVLWKNTDTFWKLDRITEEDYYTEYVNRDDGDPRHFYRNGDKIYFDLAPATAGTVRVSGVEVPAELTSQDSLIPDRFTNVVVLGSVARFKAYEAAPETNDYFGMYGNALQTMIKELASNQPVARPKFYGNV
jgi:hypothetical protein